MATENKDQKAFNNQNSDRPEAKNDDQVFEQDPRAKEVRKEKSQDQR